MKTIPLKLLHFTSGTTDYELKFHILCMQHIL